MNKESELLMSRQRGLDAQAITLSYLPLDKSHIRTVLSELDESNLVWELLLKAIPVITSEWPCSRVFKLIGPLVLTIEIVLSVPPAATIEPSYIQSRQVKEH